MNQAYDLQLALNDDNGCYNFVLKGETILSISLDKMDIDSANKIYDAIVSAMSVTLSTVSEKSNGIVSFKGSDVIK